MKVVIPWICVFGLLVGCFYLYSTVKENEKEMAKLHQDDAETARLRAENVELKQVKIDSDELVRLRNEHEELLRLRGEAGQLQKQLKQLTAQLNIAKVQSTVAVRNQKQSTQLVDENQNLRTQNEQLQQKQARVNAEMCIHNLHLIEAAKELWAADNHKAQGALPTAVDLTAYLPNNTFPACPDGGTYTVNAFGTAATCSIPGHALPKQ